jgi:hypothetical protein
MAQYFNISGESTQELLAVNSNVKVNKISLTNIEGTNKCTVDLYIEKKLKGRFYLLKGVELPIGATLIYDETKFSNNSGFSLYIKLTKSASETPTVDVIIN